MRQIINDRLAARLEQLQIERVMRAETVADRAAAIVDSTTEMIVTIASRQNNPERRERDIAALIESMLPQIEERLRKDLPLLATWSRREATSVFARTIPRKWFRAANPVTLLVGENVAPVGVVDLPGIGSADVATEPVAGRRLSDDEWERFVARNVFPPPSIERIAEIVTQPVAGVAWPERIRALSRLVEPGKVATAIVAGVGEGLNPQQIYKEVLPLVDGGVKSSARRIARTESLRVANEMQREMYKDIDDLVVGIQIVASLDERTRPHHVLRNGTVYWKDGRSPRVEELPVLPDEPNCRCFDVPVLSTPDGFGDDPGLTADIRNASGYSVPDPAAYSAWFDKADHGRRAIAVGARRYNEMKNRLSGIRSPEWADFIDRDGNLQSLGMLRAESESDREKRRRGVIELMQSRNELLSKVQAAGFVDGFRTEKPESARSPFYRGIKAPVSKALKLEGTKTQKATAATAIAAIDKVHGDGDLPEIPVGWNREKKREGFFRSRNGVGTLVQVSRYAQSPRMTLVHELGHFIDLNGIGDRYSASNPKSGEYRPNRSQASMLVNPVMAVIESSDAVQHFQKLLAGPSVIRYGNSEVKVDKKWLKYAVSREELWARAYSQYIADRSGNPELLAELRVSQKPSLYRDQWTDEDFKTIADAFDKLFSDLGWLK